MAESWKRISCSSNSPVGLLAGGDDDPDVLVSLSADPNPFPACNVVSVLDHVSGRLLPVTALADGGTVPPILVEKEQTCMGACNPTERIRDAAASDVETAFFIAAGNLQINFVPEEAVLSTLLFEEVKRSELKRSVVIMLERGGVRKSAFS